jgi:uncharacterized membrane protein required for colicin V production
VNLGEFLGGIGTVDLLIVLYFIGFFVLGFAQGTIRRLIGILSIVFSFLFAANLASPLGQFLGDNWTQFPRPYSYMIGFGTIFAVSAIALALIVQSYYKPQQLFQKARFADEILGGFLGLIQAALIFGAVLIILDSFFRIPGIPPDPQELPFIRDFWGGLDHTQFALLFRNTLIPASFLLIGLFVPDTVKATYPRRCARRAPSNGRSSLARPWRPVEPCSGPGWSATMPRAGGLGGSSRSRPTSGRRIWHRTPGSGRRSGTGSCSGLPASPTCTLSTGCTPASTW